LCDFSSLGLLSVVSQSLVGGEMQLKKTFSAKCVKNAVNCVTTISQKSSNFAPQIKFTAMRKILFTLLAALALTGCNAQNKNEKMVNEQMKKCLVVFFSHAGENYSVGNIKVGNTKIVADYISELTGADQFEIVTHKYDGMAYTPLTELAQEEARNDERPAFEGKLDNLDQYDIIFIGGPIWWGTYPQVMFTFFDTYDLNGKTIYPFTTHEGSGLGSCVNDIRRAYPNADVKPGFSIYGHEVRTNKAKVEKWISALNI
jgi:flavodoxin